MRPACPPLVYRLQVPELLALPLGDGPGRPPGHPGARGRPPRDLEALLRSTATEKYGAMEEKIRRRLNLTTLKYQRLDDLVAAIGLPKEKLCTYCWDGIGTSRVGRPFILL